MKKNNYCTFKTQRGITQADFKFYQARNGKIFIVFGAGLAALTLTQITELKLDVYSLLDFDIDLFKKAYNIPI